MEEKIAKDCEVEVSSNEAGFEGAWFRGILEECPMQSQDKSLRVRYLTLLHEDGLSPLVEEIKPNFIRPVPSEDRYIGVVLDQGSAVDANHKDGWWTGLVIKKLEKETFLVYFNSPPDIIQFQRNQLRPHLHWTGSDFVPLPIQKLDTSTFSSGAMVEVSSMEFTWNPAMIIKEIEVAGEKSFIVKDLNHLTSDGDDAPNSIVNSDRVRPVPPPFSVKEYSFVDLVEAFRDFGWHQGEVRAYLGENKYLVCLETTKEKSEFKHSELRPCKVWENGVWYDGTKPKPVKQTPSNIIKTKPLRSCSGAKPSTSHPCSGAKPRTSRSCYGATPSTLEDDGETLSEAETVVATGELREHRSADVDMNDDTPPVIIPQMEPIGEESVTHVTPSPVRSASPLNRTKSDTQGKTQEPVRNNNDLENDSTQHKISEETNSEDKSRKRKREEEQESDPKETDGTCNGSNAEINDTSNNICNDDDVDGLPLSAWIRILPTDVEEPHANDAALMVPFAKKSSFWKTYETQEVCKTPHFNPLFEVREDFREYTAIGMMVSFDRLLEEVKDLQLNASSSKLSSLSCSFDELEKHGFDVATPQSRINKILSLQDGKARKEEERKRVHKKIEAAETERAELNRQIVELKRQEMLAKEKMEEEEKRIAEMKAYAETINQDIQVLELEFKTSQL